MPLAAAYKVSAWNQEKVIMKIDKLTFCSNENKVQLLYIYSL